MQYKTNDLQDLSDKLWELKVAQMKKKTTE